MKATIEIECTPEEARRMMGLPDLTVVHERYIEQLLGMMRGDVKPELLEQAMRGWLPMGEAGMAMWKQLFEHRGGFRADG